MKTKTLPLIAAAIAICVAAAPASAQERPDRPAGGRPSLTVADFATDRTGWMPPPHLGETLAELVTDRLVAAGAFRMIDRQWLITAPQNHRNIPFDILQERALGAGVDYVVSGSVTRLSNEKHSSTGGGILPMPIVAGIVKKHTTEQAIGLTIRVISVRTGEVVASATAESSASHNQRSGVGVALVGHIPLIGGKGSSVTGLQDRLLDEALQAAVSEIADKLIAAAPRIWAQ